MQSSGQLVNVEQVFRQVFCSSLHWLSY